MAQFWALLKTIQQIIEFIGVMLGLIKRAQHDKEIKDINKGTEVAGDPSKSEKERQDAAKDLEDQLNKRT